jgi:hypothetical protein
MMPLLKGCKEMKALDIHAPPGLEELYKPDGYTALWLDHERSGCVLVLPLWVGSVLDVILCLLTSWLCGRLVVAVYGNALLGNTLYPLQYPLSHCDWKGKRQEGLAEGLNLSRLRRFRRRWLHHPAQKASTT